MTNEAERLFNLNGAAALVTGASRGVGKGVARALADCGATVYATGRTIQATETSSGKIIAVRCDHRDDSEVRALFDRIRGERGRLDILVNNVWGGYENMMENGEFTWTRPFWQQPLWRWDAMFQAGVRAHYLASCLAAPMMIARRSGLIVNISFWAAQKHIGNVAYGVSKAATDKLTTDTAHELKQHNVTIVSLYPGLVRTEAVLAAAAWLDLSNSESPEFVGRAVAALACDSNLIQRTGSVLVTATLAREYNFTDMDGKSPRALTLQEVWSLAIAANSYSGCSLQSAAIHNKIGQTRGIIRHQQTRIRMALPNSGAPHVCAAASAMHQARPVLLGTRSQNFCLPPPSTPHKFRVPQLVQVLTYPSVWRRGRS